MPSILTFSNRSVKLFTLKNRFLITAKVLHSIRICLTLQVVWQVKHYGCGSCFKMKEWVSLVWPIRNRVITTCSLLDFLDAGLHFPKVGWIWKSLLRMLLLHCCCHFVWRNLLIVGFGSVYGILDLSGVRSKADLAAESALSFPLIPMWLGVQHIIYSFLFDIGSNLLNSLMIRGFWIFFLFLNDSKTESESENIILTGSTNQIQSEPGRVGNKGVLLIPQTLGREYHYQFSATQGTRWGGPFSQGRRRWCILLSQPTEWYVEWVGIVCDL